MSTPRLVVSAAHTSASPGAIFKDLREFDLTRKILDKLLPHLTKEKIEHKAVPADLNLLKRIDWINDTGYTEENGDLFLEIHINDGNKRGLEGWYSGKDEDDNNSKNFAEKLIKGVCDKTKYENQGAHSENDHELGSLLILNQTKPIAIAIEFLYIDNEEDYKILKDEKKLDDLAKDLAKSIREYIDDPANKAKPVKKKPESDFPDFGGGFPSFGSDPMGGVNDFMNPTPAASSGSANISMDRDQRKKMIEDTYQKILGSEPKQSDLNYYLNIGVSEDDLIKRIVKAKEHEEMVKDAKDAKELRDKSTQMEADVARLQSEVNDLKRMDQNLKALLEHKNQEIIAMRNELLKRGIIRQGEYFDPNRVQPPKQKPQGFSK